MEKGVREALWKREVSKLHSNFCPCDNYLAHFQPKKPKLCTGDAAGTGGSPIDADLVEALDSVEDTERLIDLAIAEAG